MNSAAKQSFASKSSIWCRKRTNTERRLLIATGIGVLILLGLSVAVGIIADKMSKKASECLTATCIHSASTVLKYLDQTIKPCDDFYQFVCGGYLKERVIPEDKGGVGTFDETMETLMQQLKVIVQTPVDPKAPKQYHLFTKLYNLCMNETSIEKDGLHTIKIILKELGGWPVLEGDNWNEAQFDWRKSLYAHRKIGFGSSSFITLYVATDAKNSSRRVITLDEPSLLLDREFMIKGLEEKYVKAVYDFMVDIAVIFGANRNAALRELKEVLNFAIGLAKITLPKEEMRNATVLYNPMTIEDLRYNYPSVNWLEYITKVLDVPDIEINDDELIILTAPQVIRDVLNILKRTPKRVQANFIMAQTVISYASHLNEEVRKRNLEFLKAIVGSTERQPRWKECISTAVWNIRLAAGAAYVRKHFDLDKKRDVEDMVNNIRSEFVKLLKDNDWMDATTKAHALAKVEAMTTHIGYPAELMDERKVEKHYSNLELDSDNYFKSIMQLGLFEMDYNFKQLRKPVNKTYWIEHAYPTIVDAFYRSDQNSMDFPAGILQGAFFNKDRPRYMNYGSMGYIIGHELTHGFDDEGRQFDKDGNLNDWWNKDTEQAFLKKSQCIIEQYGNYTIPEVELNINGINTQGENIADNGGIKQAYLAYQTWVKENGPEPTLPGISYSPNQLFWISAANSRCAKFRKELLKLFLTVGYHSPVMFRVIGPFSNMEYFAKDFDCPVGSKMNPSHKCQVW